MNELMKEFKSMERTKRDNRENQCHSVKTTGTQSRPKDHTESLTPTMDTRWAVTQAFCQLLYTIRLTDFNQTPTKRHAQRHTDTPDMAVVQVMAIAIVEGLLLLQQPQCTQKQNSHHPKPASDGMHSCVYSTGPAAPPPGTLPKAQGRGSELPNLSASDPMSYLAQIAGGGSVLYAGFPMCRVGIGKDVIIGQIRRAVVQNGTPRAEQRTGEGK